jgi:hypothetical protein
MRSARLALLLFAATLATPASAQTFLGKWIATATTPGGAVSEEVTASRTEQGYLIDVRPIGELPPGLPTAQQPIEIVLDGDSFAYTRVVDIPDMEIVVTYKGTVSGETFTGTAEVGGIQVPYTGVRQFLGEPAD